MFYNHLPHIPRVYSWLERHTVALLLYLLVIGLAISAAIILLIGLSQPVA